MADVRKAVQRRSCPKGHFYLGQECPCEHLDRYRASFRQVASEGSGLETDRVPGAGRRLLLGVAKISVEPSKPEGSNDSTPRPYTLLRSPRKSPSVTVERASGP
jgi:hypothetical protein